MNSTKRKFIFLYLDTGAGHMAAAKVLTAELRSQYADVEVLLINGFGTKKGIGHFVFEIGYNFACNYLHGLFPLIYDLSQFRWVQNFFLGLINRQTYRYLWRLFIRERPTDIVSFHFALSPISAQVIKRLPFRVNMTVIVTDPFTLPTAWFYDNTLRYFVYSETAKKVGIAHGNVPSENITVIPFILNPAYLKPLPSFVEHRELRRKHGFDPDKKMVLLVGGGEGLPGTSEIIRQCVFHKANFTIAVVCARNKALYNALTILAKTYPKLDLHVFGFIDYLDELVKISDCMVIKAGPAMLMEALTARKPVIICKYIHNQELGNMRFAVYNDVGYFIQRPRRIYKKIKELLHDKNFDEKMRARFDALTIDTDAAHIAKLLLAK